MKSLFMKLFAVFLSTFMVNRSSGYPSPSFTASIGTCATTGLGGTCR
ncbi:MAG: hypothetical protein H7Y86_16990 [Rhizobacter sp.]|nr:hypothetical protein [Ferruginibacter sp.]